MSTMNIMNIYREFFSTLICISITFKLLITPHVNLNEDDSPRSVYFFQLLKTLLTHFAVDVAYGYSLQQESVTFVVC
jgi:hypothetical protein